MSTVRVLIADHAPTRLGVRIALDGEVDVCAEAASADAAIRAARRERPHVCIVGLEIPGGGTAAVRGICEALPGAAVIVIGGTRDVDDLLAVVRAGAVGYAPGGINAERLRRVVRAVIAHEAAVPRSMVLELMMELRDGNPNCSERLTGREVQVLGMLRRGHSTASIAHRLAISPVTVRRHVSELVRKGGVKDRAALLGPPAPSRAELPAAAD